MALLYTVSYHIMLYLHFFLLPDALYLIDVESVRERCTESHEVIASLHVDGRRVQESTSDYAVFCARAAKRGEKESYTRWAAGRKKSQTRQGIPNPAKEYTEETDACTPGPSSCSAWSISSWTRYQPRRRTGTNAGSTVVVLYLICDH